ncbi:Mdm36p NDAI_0A05000 [Naumovozyma dairenensis CBS 421]|uniref:Uncharacterized protein n=1 Tax=Naumovozyma dairenensis (strain ATCC 10597 / BCRC 20456 / CBS 421 / NBRC 0211 / NRRL Y-12639) TaxID=1071378 RepID=G0W4B7_NAUDC|nr:hypothetical protein NDAI_0A05000 [Naumovozyma dairenensis CBS 421]CCD22655.1 hypothetical protein NDAI_0A05000 [Naumovozyma dairenensis CBS 421]
MSSINDPIISSFDNNKGKLGSFNQGKEREPITTSTVERFYHEVLGDKIVLNQQLFHSSTNDKEVIAQCQEILFVLQRFNKLKQSYTTSKDIIEIDNIIKTQCLQRDNVEFLKLISKTVLPFLQSLLQSLKTLPYQLNQIYSLFILQTFKNHSNSKLTDYFTILIKLWLNLMKLYNQFNTKLMSLFLILNLLLLNNQFVTLKIQLSIPENICKSMESVFDNFSPQLFNIYHDKANSCNMTLKDCMFYYLDLEKSFQNLKLKLIIRENNKLIKQQQQQIHIQNMKTMASLLDKGSNQRPYVHSQTPLTEHLPYFKTRFDEAKLLENQITEKQLEILNFNRINSQRKLANKYQIETQSIPRHLLSPSDSSGSRSRSNSFVSSSFSMTTLTESSDEPSDKDKDDDDDNNKFHSFLFQWQKINNNKCYEPFYFYIQIIHTQAHTYIYTHIHIYIYTYSFDQ